MKLIRVNMTTQTVAEEKIQDTYKGLGGRGLTSIMINNEVPAECDPLGPDNKLIFAPGYLSGTRLINTSRLSIGAKSPLTGGIKESNVGGTVAVDLAGLGITCIVVEGCSPQNEYYILKIDGTGKPELVRGDEFKGMRTYALAEKLKAQYGERNSVTCIGPAGEHLLGSASVQTTDFDGRPCRAAGRGGLGAVMGSKGLKAIVVAKNGKNADPLADPDTFKDAAMAYAKAVRADEFSGEILPELGTAVLVAPINEAGALPCYNATKGQFEQVEKINGEALAKVISDRGGKKKHKGCANCIISCSNEFVDKDGKYVTSSLEYETIWSMGPMIGNDDLDIIAKMDFICDDIGLDTINTGVAVAVAMDAGYKEFGDGQAVIEMVEEISEGTEFGKILGNGPVAVGKYFNHHRIPAVKGQSISAYDPRGLQGMAVTYATSPMGADHTAGWVVDQNLEDFGGTLDRFSAEGQVEASTGTQLHMAGVDTVGLCDFAQSGLASDEGMGHFLKMIEAKLGEPFGAEEWEALGLRVLKAEREFNRKAGFTKVDDRLPEMFYKEPLSPHNKVVVVSNEEMETAFDF
ncbi:MAG: aldehyde ferredoxin oxidoreductase [Desulfobacterales bacterium]|nr:MAG: aldehyde ferredoxin oxidoreductase [Desulfobacterales bacterium]